VSTFWLAGIIRSMRFAGGTGTRASIALVGVAVIAMLAAMSAVGVDLGTAYLAKVTDQRAADSAAYAGALAYNASGTLAAMNSAVANLATLNGLPAGAATASLVASPSGDGNNAVLVSVNTAAPLYLAKVFQSAATLPVSATSYAEVRPNAPACIIALLAGGSGVTLSGGTTVTGAGCTVASNATVTVPCGTSITTKTLDYNSAAVPSQPCTGIKPPAGTASVNIVKTVTVNPLSGNAAIAGAFTHLASVASLTGPSGPAVAAGTTLVFGYGTPTAAQFTTVGCTGSFAGSTWTVTCPAGGTYHFGTISLSGGITLNFAAGGSPTNTYDFSGAINVSGSGASFGPGTYNVAGGIITGGGTTTTFGAGTYQIGKGTVSCSGSNYSICNTGSALTFGAGSYTVAGGIYNNGGATLSIGAGSAANSFNIGAGSAGYAINTTGTAMTLGNMTTGTFQAVGKISTGGGTNFTMSAAPAHDLNGAFNLAGTATLGAGTYTVAGNFALGAGGGGGTVTGSGVTIVTSGTFSVAAGYGNVTLTAPTSGTLDGLVVASNAAGGASFSEGASGNSLSGVFYFPSAPVTLSGAGSVGNGTGQCLELIGSTITLSGGSALASTCAGLTGSAGGGTVVLVQ
jgi:Putative Flp pilus-assembly TadE/G-like